MMNDLTEYQHARERTPIDRASPIDAALIARR
jgi:hypothetical protein